MNAERIEGLFYAIELQKIYKDENSLWFIERIIRNRNRNKKLQYFVEWQGFPKTCNVWNDADDVKDVTENKP